MDFIIELITTAGYWGYAILFLIIFLESFPPTFILPGDSLLFITGFLASQGYFDMVLLVVTFFIASVLGYMFSYAMGKKLKDFLIRSNDKYWFKLEHLEYTDQFYKKHGLKTIVIGRFVPIVRSFAPTLAGAVDMNYQKFFKMTLVGGILWTGGLTAVGYYMGQIIPDADKYLTPIIVIIVFVSFLPAIYEFAQKYFKKNKIAE